MRSSHGRQTCGCCKVVSSQEFGKIMEMKDLGIAIYRYSPQPQSKGTENGHVFILHNIGGDDVKLEELLVESEKKTISCPRCMKTIEHVKSMLKELPPANIREVTGICYHCYQKELFNCPCCEKIVDKFVKNTMDRTKQTKEEREHNKLWIIKTQLSLKKSFSNVKGNKPEPRMKPGRMRESFRNQAQKAALVSKPHKKSGNKGESELVQEQSNYRPIEQDKEKKLKVQLPLKELDLDTHKVEPRTRSEDSIQEFQAPTTRYTSTKNSVRERAFYLEMYEKQRFKVINEIIHTHKKSEEEIMVKPLKVLSFLDFPEAGIKIKPKKKKTGILKSTENGTPECLSINPYAKIKRAFTPPKQHSFESFMKSLSEPNVSAFRYFFHDRKNETQKEMKRQVSSSELVKNTKEMLQEREKAEKEKKCELVRLKQEKKILAKEEKRKREEDERKQEEGMTFTDKEEEHGEVRYKITNSITQHSKAATTDLREQLLVDLIDMAHVEDKSMEGQITIEDKETQPTTGKNNEDGQTRGKDDNSKELEEKDKGREVVQHDLTATSSFREQFATKFKDEKTRKQYEHHIAKGKTEDIAATTVNNTIQAVPDSDVGNKNAGKDHISKIEKLELKDKNQEEKEHNLVASFALKDQVSNAKELSKDENTKKQYEKDMALEEKEAIDAQKIVEAKEKQLTTDKKRIQAIPDSDERFKKGGKDQNDKIEKLGAKDKGRLEKQYELAATSVLKDQVSKQAKEKFEVDKTKKQYEKDMTLGEKKSKEAQRSIEDKENQLKTGKRRKQARPDIEDGVKTGEKDRNDKIEKLEAKDKGRLEKQHDLAATCVLKDQVTKQAKEKLEADKIRKQQERDIALGEKKAKDAEKAIQNKQKQLTTEQKQKLPQIKPDSKVDVNGTQRKGENVEQPTKEPKVKEDTHGEMITMLKEQMAKQKQQESEKEKLRKEQQKERDLAEKKLKELQSQKEERAPAIKRVILKPEVLSDDENVSDIILKAEEVTDIIKGQKIYNIKTKRAEENHPIVRSINADKLKQYTEHETDTREPQLPQHYSEHTAEQLKQFDEDKTAPGLNTQGKPLITSAKKSKSSDAEATKGVIRYTLSDRTFIDKGWTMLPTEKVVRKMNIYRMRPAKPEFDWFEHNKYKREMVYDSGEKLAEFDDHGRGRWYYRSGELALDYYDAEETNAGQRFVVYSTRQPDERGRCHPRTILATFDYSGNGIVFDHTGKIRLKYNQTEGVVLDRTIGPVSHWKWHTLNDPPVLQQVMIDTQMPYKDSTILKMGDKNADRKRPDNEEMIAIEFENFLKEKRQKLTQSFKPFQIKMKALKINDYFSLRVLDQASVYLLFRDGTTNLKINLGMVLDHKEIVDTDTAEIGEVSNTLDKLPACTDSIAGLQKAVAQAQAAERARVRHERMLKRPSESASADVLRAGCSRPLRTPVVRASLTSCDKMTPKRFKPSCCELYYSTQLC